MLHAIPDPTTWWWVVVPSPEGLATPSVYRRFDEMFPDAPATPASSAGTLAALAAGDPDRLAAALHNDLEAPAIDLRPALGDLIAHGEAEGALRGIVSGSGPDGGLPLLVGRPRALPGRHPPGRRPARRPGRQRPRGGRARPPMSPH